MGASLAGQGAQGRGGEASEGDDEETVGERGEKRRLESTSGADEPGKKKRKGRKQQKGKGFNAMKKKARSQDSGEPGL